MKQHVAKAIAFTAVCLVVSLLVCRFLEPPREGATWIYTIVPPCALILNLLWPRSRTLKALALLLLVFAVRFHGFFEMNEQARDIAAVERGLGIASFDVGIARNVLRHARDVASHALSDVWLSLWIGIALAAIPVDAVALVRRRLFNRDPSKLSLSAGSLRNNRA